MGKGANHCKITAVICAKTTEAVEMPFGLWARMGRGRTHCRHVANTIEPSVNGGDAPYVKLLSPLLLSLVTPTYTVSEIAEGFEPNTVLCAFHIIQPSSLFHIRTFNNIKMELGNKD